VDPVKLVLFNDYNCPWCYLDSAPVERLEREGLVEVMRLPYELHPWVPREGVARDKVNRGASIEPNPDVRREQHAKLPTLIAEVGLQMTPLAKHKGRYLNTKSALATAEFARERGAYDQVHERLQNGHWRGELDITDSGDLAEIVQSASLDPDELITALDDRTYEPFIDDMRAKAESLGFTQVPGHLMGPYRLYGAQTYETYLNVIEKVRASEAAETAQGTEAHR